MTPKKFAGFNLDKLFEDSEASKKAEEERLAKEEKKKKLEESLKKVKKIKPTEEPITEPTAPISSIHPVNYNNLQIEPKSKKSKATSQIVSVDYGNLQIESKSPRDGTDKTLFYYDKSLIDLRTRLNNPSARHLKPQEAFGIIIDGLEGKLSGDLKNIYDDLVSSYGEWFSLGMERKKNKLILYEDIEGLVWDGSKYVVQTKLEFSDRKEFDIKGIASETLVDLNKFEPELVEYLYGRQFDALPDAMKVGDKRAQLWLPSEAMGVRPVGRGDFNDGYYVVYAGFGDDRASRGVVPVVAPKNSP